MVKRNSVFTIARLFVGSLIVVLGLFSFAAASTTVPVTSTKPVSFTVGTPPAAPTNLMVLALASSTTNVAVILWTDNANNATGYTVERGTSTSSFSVIATTTASATHFIDNPPLGTYYYRVRAFNSYGYSAYTNTVSASFK